MINADQSNANHSTLPDLSQDDIIMMKRIKKIVSDGHDVEVRKAPDGNLKVLEVSKKNITVW